MAAAEGIRQTVRAKHGRWKAEATVTQYDGLAPGEEGEVSRALQRRLTRTARTKRESGTRSNTTSPSSKRQRRVAQVETTSMTPRRKKNCTNQYP